MEEKDFSLRHTNIVKGFAVLLLLTHHLFYTKTDIWPIIHGVSIVNQISILCKCCVAIFFFLSGYGVSASYKGNYLKFLKKRLVKIYMEYWLIWILFVPLCYFVFHCSFNYGESKFTLKLLLDLLGFNSFFNFYSFNGNWWFIGAIVSLYILFPVINFYIKSFGVVGLFPMYLILTMGNFDIGVISFSVLKWPLFTFSLGCLFYHKNVFNLINEKLEFVHGAWKVFLILFTNILFFYLRDHNNWIAGDYFDWIIAIVLCSSFYLIVTTEENRKNYIFNSLEVLGKHSNNIYMFHSLLLIYMFPSIFYSGKGSIFMVIPATLACLLLSFIIEFIKKHIGYYSLQKVLLK